MRKCLFTVAALAGILMMASGAMATLPCAANSSCALEISSTCADADLVWCPGDDSGDMLYIRVTVRNCLDDPLDGCDIRLDLSGEGDSQDEVAGAMAICGSASMTETSDINGAVEFTITGGGCGRIVLNWTATAECATPEVELCDNSDTLCVKSADFTGDLAVNFLDTFKYLPALAGGSGYCADLSCDAGDDSVNFLDTFKYLPHLAAACSCTGWTLTPTVLGDCP